MILAVAFFLLWFIIRLSGLEMERAREDEERYDVIITTITHLFDDIFQFNLAVSELTSSETRLVSLDRDGSSPETVKKRFLAMKSSLKVGFQDFHRDVDAVFVMIRDFKPVAFKLKSKISAMDGMIKKMETVIFRVFDHREILGFHEDIGLRGVMRDSIHRIESRLQEGERGLLLLKMLQVRRREKDFFMRQHQESRNKFDAAFADFRREVVRGYGEGTPAGVVMLADVDLYQELFSGAREELAVLNRDKVELFEIVNRVRAQVITVKRELERVRDGNIAYQQIFAKRVSRFSQLFLVLVFLGFSIIVLMFFKDIRDSLLNIGHQAKKVAGGDYLQEIPVTRKDEIGDLARHIQEMKQALQAHAQGLEAVIRSRTRHLTLTNEELLKTIDTLEKTRSELVENEKMASLGRLVAGFAHEINTPIGVALTSCSIIPESVKALNGLLEGDEVSFDDLERVLKRLDGASNLLVSNLTRASDLVTRFKRTSADQSSETIRSFNVLEVVQDVRSSLNNVFKRTGIDCRIDCPDDLKVYSQPGALGQLLTGLYMNAFRHAFAEGRESGIITISAQRRGADGRIVLTFVDTGRGIPEEHMDKLFEPFFSTARDKGGSGLGLYIAYNIATMQLEGDIRCQSRLGRGTRFIITFPDLREKRERPGE